MQTTLLKERDPLLDRGGWKLRIFTYLRGLDGRRDSPSTRAAAEGAAGPEPLKALLNAHVLSEESSGTSQFDYLRRQAMLLRLDHLKEPVVAVGVLGSDVYDKLTVSKRCGPSCHKPYSLRPIWMRFTCTRTTCRLHGTCSFRQRKGLRPEMGGGEDRWSVPPMRDSYQTILFEATQRLVRSQTLEERSKIARGRDLPDWAGGDAFRDWRGNGRCPQPVLARRADSHGSAPR